MDLTLGHAATGPVAQAAEDLIAQPARARRLGPAPVGGWPGQSGVDILYAPRVRFPNGFAGSGMRLKFGIAAVKQNSQSRIHEKLRSANE
jgi:hypothetical protein